MSAFVIQIPQQLDDLTIIKHVNQISFYSDQYNVYNYLLDLLKTVLGKNNFDKQKHEKIEISIRGIV